MHNSLLINHNKQVEMNPQYSFKNYCIVFVMMIAVIVSVPILLSVVYADPYDNSAQGQTDQGFQRHHHFGNFTGNTNGFQHSGNFTYFRHFENFTGNMNGFQHSGNFTSFHLSGNIGNISPNTTSTNTPIPSWVKNNAKYWSEGQVGDSEFVQGLQYLIHDGMIKVPSTQVNSTSSQPIPHWIKSTANYWSTGQLSDGDFIKGIQFLISTGMIKA